MQRLLIFTAGTSLLDNLRDPGKFGERALVDALCYKEANAWRSVLRRAEGIRRELVAYGGHFASLDLADPPRRSWATAEMAGLYLLRRGQEQSADRLVLLCSDTGEGAFCAFANAMVLGREVRYYAPKGYYTAFGEIRTLAGLAETETEHGFHPSLLTIRLPSVEVIVVKDLDATRPEEFERHAIPALVRTIAEIYYNRHTDEQTVLNYTGGFKAGIPTLSQAAAVAGNIELVCLYEEAAQLVHQPLIRISLGPETEGRLLGAGKDTERFPDPLRDCATLDSVPDEEWPFYEERPEGGLGLSGLGCAMQELLQARERWVELRVKVH